MARRLLKVPFRVQHYILSPQNAGNPPAQDGAAGSHLGRSADAGRTTGADAQTRPAVDRLSGVIHNRII